jgi:hypothetical protein
MHTHLTSKEADPLSKFYTLFVQISKILDLEVSHIKRLAECPECSYLSFAFKVHVRFGLKY